MSLDDLVALPVLFPVLWSAHLQNEIEAAGHHGSGLVTVPGTHLPFELWPGFFKILWFFVERQRDKSFD